MSPSSRRAWIEILEAKTSNFGKENVALLAEGVDRNMKRLRKAVKEPLSPSSRRAWIEIRKSTRCLTTFAVALLAEGVDRNGPAHRFRRPRQRSPSSRRAWIEIRHFLHLPFDTVSPSSRRAWIEMVFRYAIPPPCASRPPRGGRGYKSSGFSWSASRH